MELAAYWSEVVTNKVLECRSSPDHKKQSEEFSTSAGTNQEVTVVVYGNNLLSSHLENEIEFIRSGQKDKSQNQSYFRRWNGEGGLGGIWGEKERKEDDIG